MIIRRRPRSVRRTTASRVDGSEWTLKLTSSAESGLAGADESMPDIEEGDPGRDGEPLESVAVVLLHVAGRCRPVPAQAIGRCGSSVLLDDRERQEIEPGFARERCDVEILPDRPAGRAGEVEPPRHGQGD